MEECDKISIKWTKNKKNIKGIKKLEKDNLNIKDGTVALSTFY